MVSKLAPEAADMALWEVVWVLAGWLAEADKPKSVFASKTAALLGPFLSTAFGRPIPVPGPKTVPVGATASDETGMREDRGCVLATVEGLAKFSFRETVVAGISPFTPSPTTAAAGTIGAWEVGGGTTVWFKETGAKFCTAPGTALPWITAGLAPRGRVAGWGSGTTVLGTVTGAGPGLAVTTGFKEPVATAGAPLGLLTPATGTIATPLFKLGTWLTGGTVATVGRTGETG